MPVSASRIIQSVRNRPVHAYLLLGRAGSYKEGVAASIAAVILNVPENEVSKHRDYIEIQPEKNTISIDAVRELLDTLKTRPASGGKRVVLIREAGAMTHQAQNCLLKTLEEPASTVFVLLSDSAEPLLPTVRSRCLGLYISPGGRSEIAEIIRNRYGLTKEQSEGAASFGSLGAAEEWASPQMMVLREATVDLVRRLFAKDVYARSRFSDFLRANKDDIESVLGIMLALMRDMLYYRECGNARLYCAEYADVVRNGAKYFTSARLSCIIERVLEAQKRLRGHANFAIETEAMLLDILEERI